ncbi:hypothetical protein FPCIR_13667 [Fusarium pseudocircinatum]|uniref:Uncharacterized protein n=1 Tax=Fusarium pseudocircinatum TaxID=56676 RepID=A0A8H5KI38_9HYPO|nr:hypothetical protein FPCIR_13667 [Fusarium pseudocircinatum]
MQKVLAIQRASRLPSAPQWSPVVSARQALLSLYIGSYSKSFDSLPSFLEESSASHLQVSVDAVGLAFMAFQLNRRDLVPLANERYLAALRSVRSALRSFTQSTSNAADQSLKDATLQSALLLDLYEKIAYQHYQSSELPGPLLSHVHGALSLVQSRPRGEFSNTMIQKLAAQSVHTCVVSCSTANIPVPEAVVRLYHDLSPGISSTRWFMQGLVIHIVNLNADIRGGRSNPSNVLKRARELYSAFSDIERSMPRFSWPRRRDTCETLAFNGYYDVYQDHRDIQLFNLCRCERLDLALIIQKIEPSAKVSEYIAQATEAICASVPGLILPAARPQNTLPLSPLQVLECSAVLPALVAAARYTQDPAMQDWIPQTLTHMANHGIQLAHNVAHIIMFEPHVGQWDVFELVGSYSILAL